MKTLIFDHESAGHHLEYMHHYYLGAIERSNEEFVFCTVADFTQQYAIEIHPNIKLSILTENELQPIKHQHGLALKIQISKLIRNKAKQFNADRILLTNFRNLLPVLPFYIPSTVRLRGIIYSIYLYRQSSSTRRFIGDLLNHFLMARSRVIDKVFILNDADSTAKLNKIYHTSKFTYLPDPVPEIDESKLVDIRQQLNIPINNKVFLHFGHMEKRKGTLEILDAISLMGEEFLTTSTFVFAGRVSDSIRDNFYHKVEMLKNKTQLLIFDEFINFNFIYNLCYSADVILAPYLATDCSSGVLGYGAVFQKPVIAPSHGLIGKLMQQYDLGLCIDTVDANALSKAFEMNIHYKSHNYVDEHRVLAFDNNIL